MPVSKRPVMHSRKRNAPVPEAASLSGVDTAFVEGSKETKRFKHNPTEDASGIEAGTNATDNGEAKGDVDSHTNTTDRVSKVPDLRNQNREKKLMKAQEPNDETPPKTQQHLEEEIFLVEQSLRTLLSRQQTIEVQEQQSNAKRKAIMETLAHQIRRKQQLDDSQVQHLRLLQELETSLAKSHDLLLRLNQSNNNNTISIAASNTTYVNDTSEDTNTFANNSMEGLNGSDDAVAENEEQEQQAPMELHLAENTLSLEDGQQHIQNNNSVGTPADEATASDTGSEDAESLASFRRCPVPVLHHDKARLATFWKAHSQLVPTKNTYHKTEEDCPSSSTTTTASNTLFVFSPCVSSPTVVEKIMTVTATEILAEGARLMAMAGNDATDNLSAVADYRRQTLWNTCLDFCLMAMGSSNNSKNNNNNNNNNSKNNNDRNDSSDESHGKTSIRIAEDGEVPDKDKGKTGGANANTGAGSGDLSATHDNITMENATQSTTGDENEASENLLHLDPNVALCPYELAGVCADSFCPYQHLNTTDRPSHQAVLPRELLPLPQLRLPEDPLPLESVLPVEESPGLKKKDCVITGSFVEGGESRDVPQNKTDPSTISGTDNLESVTMKDITETEAPVDESIESDSHSQNPLDSVNGPDDVDQGDSHLMQEFDDNSDFVALGEIDDDNDADDDEEDLMNLETAGLVGFTKENHHDLNREASLTNGCKQSFWWLPVSFEDKISDDTTKPTSLEEWLYSYGEFSVTRDGEEACSDIFLEFQGRSPTSEVELCEFTGKIVDCSKLLLHAGRFDLSGPLCTLAQNCVYDFKTFFLNEEVHGPLLPPMQKVVNIFEIVLETTGGVLEKAFYQQNGVDITIRSQLSLALFSDFLERLHKHLRVEACRDADLNWCFDFLDACMITMKDSDPSEELREIGKATEESAHYIRGTIKLAVLRNNLPPTYWVSGGAKDTDDKFEGASAEQGGDLSMIERVSSSLLEDVQTALTCASSIRSGFSLHKVADDFLRPIWSIVKTSLRPLALTSVREIPQSTIFLRSVLFIVYSIKGAFEGAVDFLNGVAGDPHRLSALSYSSLVQLDIVCHGILKSLKAILSNDVDTKLFITLLTPIMAASVSFACHLGLYTKGQLRIEDLLDTSTKDGASGSLFFYSELLWSQLAHLRSSLPFSQKMTATKVQQPVQTILPIDLSESHELVANKINAFGVQLHHLSLSGDWTILSRLGPTAQEARSGQGEKQLAVCVSLLKASSKPVTVDVHIPAPLPTSASLKTVAPGCSVGLATFPLSLLVYGWKIVNLHLGWCKLQELPLSIGLHMPNLKAIDVSNNHIKFLPDSIGDIAQLETLLANNNLIASLPANMTKLLNLRVLELENNALESFPSAVWKLKHLEVLKLSGNALDMTDKAPRLVLGLPELRAFSSAKVGTSSTETQDECI